MNSDYRKYVRYYVINNDNYGSVKISFDPSAVTGFVNDNGCTLFDFYGSLFAFYLSRINRTGGCLLRTNIPEGESGKTEVVVRVDTNKEESFRDLIRSFKPSVESSYEMTLSDDEEYLKEAITYYNIYDLTSETAGAEDKAYSGSALSLFINESSVELFYHTDLFTGAFAERMIRNIGSLAESVMNTPDKKLIDTDILSSEEKSLLSEFTMGKTIKINEDNLLSGTIREQARKAPDRIAVDDGINKVTYGELERSSNSVADCLYRKYNIGPGSRVGLMLPRNYHFPELVLALNKNGAAYIPIDTRFPVNRIGQMMMIAQADCLITTRDIKESLRMDSKVICLEDLDFKNDVEVEIKCKSDEIFAILFTSGTTGMPKGVMFKNRQVPWAVTAIADMFHFNPGDLAGTFFSFSFVASFIIFAVLYLAGTVRLYNEEEQKNPLLLIKDLKGAHMNSLILPPTVGIPVYENEDLNLDYLLLAGAKLHELSKTERHTKLVNFYGTTEIIFAVSKIYDRKDMVEGNLAVGRPVPNTWAYILDADNHQMPVGVPGEICVAGGHITEGYCNDAALTAERFVPNPYSDCDINRIMYRTGDIGFYNENGEIEIIGREDDQLAVRGFRVESNEIIRIMKGVPEIDEVYLDVDNDNLIVYYTASDELDMSLLEKALKNELPYYMVPSMFVKLDKIPLNMNGKIDKARLKTLVEREDLEIADETLRKVVDAFKEVLKLDCVLPDDDFVSLGGNSLAAMRLLLLLHEKFDVSVSANELISLSTPNDIANYIKSGSIVHASDYEDKYSFDGSAPLSESQLNIYLDESVHDKGTAYNNPFIIRFKDKKTYTPDVLRKAVTRLYEIFPVLKARVKSEEGSVSLAFDAKPQIDEGNKGDVKSFVRKFEVEKNLSRFLISDDEDSTALCADFHHLIFDGSSLNVLLNEFFAVLNGEDTDYVDKGVLNEVAFEELVFSKNREESQTFFDEMLADRDEVYDLVPSVDASEKFEYMHTFEADREKLGEFMRSHSLTDNQLFASAFAYTLSGFSGSNKVMFSLIESGRGHIDLSRSVGMFVKTMPVLIDCSNNDTADYLKHASERINSVMKHDLYPFRLLAGRYDLNANIQFQYSHDIYADALNLAGTDYEIEECTHDLDADFSFNILNSADGKFVIKLMCSSLYSKDFAKHFAESYEMILKGMTEAGKLGDITYTSAGDIALLDKYNLTETAIRDKDILDSFNDSLSEYPDNKLVEYNDVSYTYAEGAFVSDKIRNKLLELGIGSHDRVCFLVPRSEVYMFTILGIMSLGAAYVPLDGNLPDDRIGFMISDARARVLIVTDDTVTRAGNIGVEGVTVLNISSILNEERGKLDHLPVSYGNIACLLYTSGSTGIPKGVKITRESLKYFIDFQANDINIGPGDTYGMYASIGFDVSMGAIFSSMYSGACLAVIPESVRLDIPAMNRYFIEHNVTHTHITTQIAKLFISQIEETSLKVLVTGGEKLGEVDEVRDYRIVDTYGPTETCVYVTSINLKDKIDHSSVGFILNNTRAYVLDNEKRRLPVGAVGGLYLSGPQLADGYLNRESETSKVFTDNPFEEGGKYGRLYYTGDVARVLPDGSYCIIGRRDGQVKIRGNRVELSEIEAVIRSMDSVTDVTTRVINRGGNYELVAYVVADDMDAEEIETAVADYMNDKVPAYMIPSFVVKMDSIPVNVNGKVDKRALPDVDLSSHQSDYAAPRNEMERLLVSGFEKVFGQEKISIYDDFFRLGGDSLAAVKLITHLGKTGITVGNILSMRTPAAIAAGMNTFSYDPNVYTLESGCPLNNTQEHMYRAVTEQNVLSIIPSIIPIDNKYTNEQIKAALEVVNEYYPDLSQHVELRDGEPYMVKGEMPQVMTGSLNIASVLSRLIRDFDVHEGLARYMIVRLMGKCYLVSIFHHIVFDQFSEKTFRTALFNALDGIKPDSVDDAFLKLSAYQQQIKETESFEEIEKYARDMLSNLDEVGFYRNESGKQGQTGLIVEDLGQDRSQIEETLKKLNVSKTLFFMGVLTRTLSRLTGREDVFFAFNDNSRDILGNYDSIGLYMTTFPAVTHDEQKDAAGFMKDLSEVYYKLISNSYYPYGNLLREFNPFPRVYFQFFPQWATEVDNYGDLPVNETIANLIVSRLSGFLAEMQLEVFEKGDRYNGRVIFSGYYTRKMAKTFMDTYKTVLSEIINECADN